MATRGFQEIDTKAQVELLDDAGRVVGVARDVPFIGRRFHYHAPRAKTSTIFQWVDRQGRQGRYVGGCKFWEEQP